MIKFIDFISRVSFRNDKKYILFSNALKMCYFIISYFSYTKQTTIIYTLYKPMNIFPATTAAATTTTASGSGSE